MAIVASLGVDTEELAANDFKMKDIFVCLFIYFYNFGSDSFTTELLHRLRVLRGKYRADN